MPLGSTGSAGSAGPLEAEPNWERSEPLPPAAYRVVDELLRRFGLGSPLEIEVVTSGLLNQNLRAATAAGRFFLKGYRYTDPALILREHRLMAHVAAAGLPVALPLAAPGGATFLRVGGRFWAVFPFIADRQLEPAAFTVAHAAELGGSWARSTPPWHDIRPLRRLPFRPSWPGTRRRRPTRCARTSVTSRSDRRSIRSTSMRWPASPIAARCWRAASHRQRHSLTCPRSCSMATSTSGTSSSRQRAR